MLTLKYLDAYTSKNLSYIICFKLYKVPNHQNKLLLSKLLLAVDLPTEQKQLSEMEKWLTEICKSNSENKTGEQLVAFRKKLSKKLKAIFKINNQPKSKPQIKPLKKVKSNTSSRPTTAHSSTKQTCKCFNLFFFF